VCKTNVESNDTGDDLCYIITIVVVTTKVKEFGLKKLTTQHLYSPGTKLITAEFFFDMLCLLIHNQNENSFPCS